MKTRGFGRWLAAALVAAAVSALVGGCARHTRPNVLFICVDTLRPDHLGYEGCSRPTSPAIDALAAEGVRFKTCYSASGWTLPSMATIMTGVYPKDHLATDFHWSIAPDLPTLAEVLRKAGYDTRAYVSHVVLKPAFGFGEGFASFDYSVLNVGHPHDVSTGRQLTDLVLADLPKTKEPFFYWVHYFDPHFAYLEHADWRYFGDRDVDRYDQEIAFTDSQIRRLLDELKHRKMYDNTIIVFTADHGEEFGEHGGSYHETLHQEVLLCPLVIRAPSLKPGERQIIAEQIDILPTILGMLDIPAPPGLPGRDLLASPGEPRPVFVERDRPFPWVQRGVIDGKDKLFVIELADSAKIPWGSHGNYAPVLNVIPGVYMYDLARDPGETTNVYNAADQRAKELLALLARHFAVQAKRGHPVEVDEELQKKLRSLGYIR
jgi:arylsulfatase A-like enzyme